MLSQLDLNITKSIKASDLLYTEDVYTCEASANLHAVTIRMSERNIGCVVVIENNKPIGIFTERDLLKKVVAHGFPVDKTKISQVMTPHPVCIHPTTPLNQILSAMRLGKFRHLVVTDENHQVVGIISIKDILNWVTDRLNS